MLTVEEVLAANKANVETIFGLASKAFEGVEKLVDLHLAASRALLSESASQAQSALSVKDVQELLALQSSLLQPLTEKAASYGRELYDIATSTGAEFGEAFEVQFADAQNRFLAAVDGAAQNAPAGSETAVALMKSAVAAANNVLESAQNSARQAASLVDSSFKAATASTVEAAKTASKKQRESF